MKMTLVPSYPAPDKESLLAVMDVLVGISDGFQIDFVDGEFVPAVSWPFSAAGAIELQELKKYSSSYELEIDCMVEDPGQYSDLFVEAGFKRVVLHLGSSDKLIATKDFLQEEGLSVGLAFTSDADYSEVVELIPGFDYVQVMGIKEVGKQGQPFDDRTYGTVRKLRKQFPDLEIAVDGGVNANTIPQLVDAGANRLAPGSAITKSDDKVAAYKQLQSLI